MFTTVPALRIEGAMRAWNGIPDKQSVDFDESLKSSPRGRPSRVEQRRAADRAIAQFDLLALQAAEVAPYHDAVGERLMRRDGEPAAQFGEADEQQAERLLGVHPVVADFLT